MRAARRIAGPLYRADVHAHPLQPAGLPVVGHRVLGPQAAHQLQAFHHARDALFLRYVEGIELDLAVAETDAEDEIALRNDVQRRDGLRDVHRVVEVEQQDAEPGGHLARLRDQAGDEGHDLELLVVALVEVVMAREQGIPAAVAGVVHHGDLIAEGAHHVGVAMVLVVDEESDFHRGHPVHELRDAAFHVRREVK